MEYTYGGPIEEDVKTDSIDFIKEIVKKPVTYWVQGGGDSSIELKENGSLVFFKTDQGFYIEHLPSATSPLVKPDYEEIKVVKHYVGGEPTEVPDICLCNDEVALKIFKYFIETGKLNPDYKWVDIYDYIEFNEE